MITIKTKQDIEKMRDAGKISQEALLLAGELVKPGITTFEIDKAVYNHITKSGATPSFLNYHGFPASACISINDVVIHGIPSKKHVLKEGDIVSIDVGAYYNGFHGDNAWTFPCGEINEEAKKLLEATKESLFQAIAQATVGNRLGDVGSAVQEYVEARSYSVVREFIGHGIGANLHEDPAVPNYGIKGRGTRLVKGMTICIEPMINMGAKEVYTTSDGWTVKTKDKQISAHFEHAIAITDNGPIILTQV